jgi:hypothetical protein
MSASSQGSNAAARSSASQPRWHTHIRGACSSYQGFVERPVPPAENDQAVIRIVYNALDQGEGIIVGSRKQLQSSRKTVNLKQGADDSSAFFTKVFMRRADENLIALVHKVYGRLFGEAPHATLKTNR